MADNADKPSSRKGFFQFSIIDLLMLTAVVAISARLLRGDWVSGRSIQLFLLVSLIVVWMMWAISLIDRGKIGAGFLLFALLAYLLFVPLWPLMN